MTRPMPDPEPHIAILMATFNGGRYLDEQLASIAAQSHRNWSLWISDDGSRDATRKIIANFHHANPDRTVRLLDGPQMGASQNFFALCLNPDIEAEYFALCDQDDVWFPAKLEQAVAAVSPLSASGPLLFGTRTRITDQSLRELRLSEQMSGPFGFANALVQNFAGGNTMVFNTAARRLLSADFPTVDVAAFDWFLYQLVTGAGGRVIYDPRPSLCYRQHGGNEIGQKKGVISMAARAYWLTSGRYKGWNATHLNALRRYSDRLTEPNRKLLGQFANVRESRGYHAVRKLRQSGISRQTRLEQHALVAATFLGRV